MKNKRNVLYSLMITLAGVINFPLQAQQKETLRISLKPKTYSFLKGPRASFVQSSKIERAIFGLLHGMAFLNMMENLLTILQVK